MNWETGDDLFKDIDEEVTEVTPTEIETETQEQEVEQTEIENKEFSFEDLDEESTEEEQQDTTQDVETKSVPDVLKSTAQYQAEKYGIDISEVEKWDEETYSAFIDKVDEVRLEQKYGEMKSSNPFADAILSVVEAGGDTSDLIDLFKEQKQFHEIDTSTIEGKVEKIRKYYSDVAGKKPEWIERQIKRISLGDDTSEIEAEFNAISQEYDEFFQEETQRQVQQAQQIKQQKEALFKKQVTALASSLEAKKVNKKESQELVDFVYKDRYTIQGTDTRITEFDRRIADAKKNPELLIELASYLKDPEKYKTKIATEINNKKEEKKFVTITNKQETKSKTEPITKFRL